jgi:rare lipoprotein A
MMMIAAVCVEYCLTSILAKRAMITKSPPLVAVLVLGFLLGPACAAEIKSDECGLASVYATETEETASGEDTLPEDFTAAHRTLPFGTLVQVDNQKSGRSAVVRITDRGPFISGRIIDLSQVAARALGISGLTQVCLNITCPKVDKSGKNDC